MRNIKVSSVHAAGKLKRYIIVLNMVAGLSICFLDGDFRKCVTERAV